MFPWHIILWGTLGAHKNYKVLVPRRIDCNIRRGEAFLLDHKYRVSYVDAMEDLLHHLLDCESGWIWSRRWLHERNDCKSWSKAQTVNEKENICGDQVDMIYTKLILICARDIWFHRTGRGPCSRGLATLGVLWSSWKTGCISVCTGEQPCVWRKWFRQKVRDQETKDLTLSSWIEPGGGNACYYAFPETLSSHSWRRRSSTTLC